MAASYLDRSTGPRLDQSADGGPTDVEGKAPGNLGAWEVSGIVDASSAFGTGAFLVDMQVHSSWIEKALGADVNGDGATDFTDKREGGGRASRPRSSSSPPPR